MRFEYEGKKFRIRFRHSLEEKETTAYLEEERKWRDGQDTILVNTGIGYARCSEGDKFCYETGRYVAMKRLARQFTGRGFRSAIWHAYWNRFPGQRPKRFGPRHLAKV